jgi:beta-glucuronidase
LRRRNARPARAAFRARAHAARLLLAVAGAALALVLVPGAPAQLPGLPITLPGAPAATGQTPTAPGPISASTPAGIATVAPPVGTPPPAPTGAYTATAPTTDITDVSGQSNRFLLDGAWLFRSTGANLPAQTSTAGWTPVDVPYAWNALDYSMQSYSGEVGWYRRDFLLPAHAAGVTWLLTFESVNYSTDIWLNGHEIASHTGEFLPFDVELPARYLHPGAGNMLVMRVDSQHGAASLPPYFISPTTGDPVGGWWNYAGILRDVYLREVHKVDIAQVLVTPALRCARCAATVRYTVVVHDYSAHHERVRLTSHYGSELVPLGTKTVSPGASTSFTGTVTVASPHLWSPTSPHLYNLTVDAYIAGAHVADYSLQSGIKSIQVVSGHLYLNFKPVHLRGVGIQEDSLDNGFALDDAQRAQIISEAKALGATIIRSQYPLDPELEQLADRNGILLWSEVPVFTVAQAVLDTESFRAEAESYLRQDILDNGSHASVAVWSIGNELDSRPDAGQRIYIRQAVSLAHSLDPTHPVGLSIAAYPSVLCQAAAYRPLQILGFNDYFGWYPGPNGQIADEELLSPYLNAVHDCYRHQAVMITEFGAEANRDGPADERGTYAFQSAWAQYHLSVYATKPWLSGAIYWALEDFRVWPAWNGGNPLPDAPFFNKGLVTMTGVQKPAFAALAQVFHDTQQIG